MSDLRKLDPMARKMRVHVDGFYKAIEENDGFAARNHITEIQKYAEYLSTDVDNAVTKSEKIEGVNDIYAGGVPVLKFNTVEKIHPVVENVMPGIVRTNRIGSIMRPQSNRSLQ